MNILLCELKLKFLSECETHSFYGLKIKSDQNNRKTDS
jgi:hypothetical protein